MASRSALTDSGYWLLNVLVGRISEADEIRETAEYEAAREAVGDPPTLDAPLRVTRDGDDWALEDRGSESRALAYWDARPAGRRRCRLSAKDIVKVKPDAMRGPSAPNRSDQLDPPVQRPQLGRRRVKLRDTLPNPFRDLATNPEHEEKVAALKQSMEDTSFWENLVARPSPTDLDKVQLCFGYHRLTALKQAKGEDHEIDILVRDLDDEAMIKMLATENLDVWRHTVAAVHEALRAAVRAYADGKIELAEPDPKAKRSTLRYAPSFIAGGDDGRGAAITSKPYTATTLAGMLGWTKKNGRPQDRVKYGLAALELIEQGHLTDADFFGLGPRQAQRLVQKNRKQLTAAEEGPGKASAAPEGEAGSTDAKLQGDLPPKTEGEGQSGETRQPKSEDAKRAPASPAGDKPRPAEPEQTEVTASLSETPGTSDTSTAAKQAPEAGPDEHSGASSEEPGIEYWTAYAVVANYLKTAWPDEIEQTLVGLAEAAGVVVLYVTDDPPQPDSSTEKVEEAGLADSWPSLVQEATRWGATPADLTQLGFAAPDKRELARVTDVIAKAKACKDSGGDPAGVWPSAATTALDEALDLARTQGAPESLVRHLRRLDRALDDEDRAVLLETVRQACEATGEGTDSEKEWPVRPRPEGAPRRTKDELRKAALKLDATWEKFARLFASNGRPKHIEIDAVEDLIATADWLHGQGLDRKLLWSIAAPAAERGAE